MAEQSKHSRKRARLTRRLDGSRQDSNSPNRDADSAAPQDKLELELAEVRVELAEKQKQLVGADCFYISGVKLIDSDAENSVLDARVFLEGVEIRDSEAGSDSAEIGNIDKRVKATEDKLNENRRVSRASDSGTRGNDGSNGRIQQGLTHDW
ncbi:hypothetical protein FGRMN_7248 [Fusarium graminum]|nr:hypothetical protein FGRMN_7248 [Fusarium graminum]